MLAILCIDNRADITVVKADLISPAIYTRKCTKVDSWRGNVPTEHSLAIVQIDVNPVQLKQEVIVNGETLQEDACKGEDNGLDLVAKLIEYTRGLKCSDKSTIAVRQTIRHNIKLKNSITWHNMTKPVQLQEMLLITLYENL